MLAILPERVRSDQKPCVQPVELYRSEVWGDPKDIGRRDDLQLLLNWQARATLGALPNTPLGPFLRDPGITPAPVGLN